MVRVAGVTRIRWWPMAEETRPMKTAPKITWRYVDDGGELALFWTSPWGGAEEKIATFWWPGHPPEATEEVEKMFEAIAARACLGIGPPINAEFLRSRLGPSLLEQLEGADARPLRSARCPSCDSPDPKRHPAMQHGGEVQLCFDAWHGDSRGCASNCGRQATPGMTRCKECVPPKTEPPFGSLVCRCGARGRKDRCICPTRKESE